MDQSEIPMDHLEIPVDANGLNWWETYNERVARMKNLSIPMSYEGHPPFTQRTKNYLYEAVRDGNAENFVSVSEQACQLSRLPLSFIWGHINLGGESLLHVAAKFGREKIALLIAYHYPELLLWGNIRGDTALHVAARAKNIDVMKVVLFVYARYGYASLINRPQDKELFLMYGNKHGNTALHEAILSKHLDGVKFLLNIHSRRALILYWNNFPFKSPMCLAVVTGDEEILRLLLQIPFPSSEPFHVYHGNSPLHAAILERSTPALLQKIVNIREELMNLTDENGDTPLHYAANTGYVEGVRVLLKKSTFAAFERNSNGNLPIHLACQRGHVRVVKELLQLEYRPDASILLNNDGRNILHIAAMNGKNNVAKYLLREPMIHGEIVNERDVHGDTPLHLASRKFCLWTLLLLSRDKRIDVNLVNNEGLTARDIVLRECRIPMTRQEFLSNVILQSAGVPLKANMSRVASVNTEWNVKDAANTLMLVAILIATVTFAAGFTVPGGVYSSDDADPKKRGMVVLAHQTLFKIFMAFNTVAMYSSTLGSVIMIWIQLGDHRFAQGVYRVAKLFVYVAIITMSVAFLAAIRLVVSNNSLLANVITVIGVIFIFFMLFIRILGRFPLGIRLPIFRLIGELFIRIILILFYGRNDTLIGEVIQVNQVDRNGNQSGQPDQENQAVEVHDFSWPRMFSEQ